MAYNPNIEKIGYQLVRTGAFTVWQDNPVFRIVVTQNHTDRNNRRVLCIFLIII